jgi:dTDP-4-amino-4,6-dideoxygalactose transaminase
MSRFYHIAPAGTPTTLSDMAKILGQRIRGGIEPRISDKIKQLSSSQYCIFFNSGRTALYYSLRALSKLSSPEKNRVVIPAYTCFSVASAVAKTGLKMELVDMNPDTLDYDFEKLEKIRSENILAIVGCDLLGVLCDWKRLQTIAKRCGAYLVDDAAQSMGSSLEGNAAGSFGDLGFYSLGRGKNLSAYAGGILVTNNEEIAEVILKETKALRKPGLAAESQAAIQIGLYGLFLRPSLYWIPNSIPFLHLGETAFDINFATGGLSRLQMSACLVLLSKLEMINEKRRHHALELGKALCINNNIKIPGFNLERCPIYLRLPLLMKDRQSRDNKLRYLINNGIMASAMYPSTIRQIPGIESFLISENGDYPGAQAIADRLLTVPTHSYLNEKSIKQIVSVLSTG